MGNCCSMYGECKKESYENAYLSAAVCSMRGFRKTMQDSHSICLSIPNHPHYALFAIFDGFNGFHAAQYLQNNLVETLNKLNTLNDDELIIDAINKMDETFLNLKDENININAGSTLVFALINNQCGASSSCLSSLSLIDPSSVSMSTPISPSEIAPIPLQSTSISLIHRENIKIRIFWAGDSRALLIREKNDDFEALTIDHHCSLPMEAKRICNPLSNGTIIDNKIDGITELSRCFGCYQMKNNKKLKKDEQKQICVAQCKHISCKRNETLLLFSDGLTQKWSNKQVVNNYNFQWNQHKNYSNSMINSVNDLCEQCIDNGSIDNITAISIRFN